LPKIEDVQIGNVSYRDPFALEYPLTAISSKLYALIAIWRIKCIQQKNISHRTTHI